MLKWKTCGVEWRRALVNAVLAEVRLQIAGLSLRPRMAPNGGVMRWLTWCHSQANGGNGGLLTPVVARAEAVAEWARRRVVVGRSFLCDARG